MKLPVTRIVLLIACCWAGSSRAQLQILPDKELQRVFSGNARNVVVTFRNAGPEVAATNISVGLFQTGSATAVPLGKPTDWKKLQVLPGQTVLESVHLDFPGVKAETKFLVQWLTGTNRVLATTEVMLYPTNLLTELKTLAGDSGPGVFDPQNQLKPLLKNSKVDFEDLEALGFDHFSGRLAIIGPFQSASQMGEGLAERISELARKNAGVVWLQPPRGKKAKLMPSFYSVIGGTNAVVVVKPELVSGLPENPQSQLNLIFFCRFALQPEWPQLPVTTIQH